MQSSTQRRTNKHMSKKEKFMQNVKDFKIVKVVKVDKVDNIDVDEDSDDQWISLRDSRRLVNTLIDHGETYIEHCVKLFESINTHLGSDVPVTVCAHCAKRFGIKRCAACPRSNGIRYCSRNCQLAHWPKHKAVCSALNEK